MTKNHTSGSWYAMTGDTGGVVDQAAVFSSNGTEGAPTFIADTMGDGEVPLEQRKANAQIMAAGLKMLKALRLIEQFNIEMPQRLRERIREAIDQAERG